MPYPNDLVIPSTVFYEASAYTVTGIAATTFAYCKQLTSVKIPDSVKSIGGEAFADCTGLTSINIPNSVKSIGYCAFVGCTALTSIKLPDGMKSIEEGLFGECRNLTSVNIPDGVTNIKSLAFEKCTSLTSVNIPDGVTNIGKSAFSGCTSLTSVNIGKGVKNIESYAFKNCSNLNTLNLNCTEVCDWFRDILLQVTSVTLGDNVKNISYSVFTDSGITAINIPDGVTSIGEWAFLACTKLKSVYIGKGVTSIGNEVFYDCHSLTSVTSYGIKPFTINNTVFKNNSSNCILYVPEGTKDAYIAAGWTEEVFKGGIVEMEPTGLQDVTQESLPTNADCYYDLNGRPHNQLQRGLNIIRMSDGTVKKTIFFNTP